MSTAAVITSDKFDIKGSLNLPIVGAQGFDNVVTLSGLSDEVANEILNLDGGKFTADFSAKESADGVDLSASILLPIVGAEKLDFDLKLTGLAKTAVDEILALDGGAFTVVLSVVKVAA